MTYGKNSPTILPIISQKSLADLIARDNVQTVALRQNSASLDSALSVTGI
jgi:Rrf2 family iron-sulfur cluster assembly transcriptional regulator